MTLGTDVKNLAHIKMDSERDPGQLFTRRDILLLYLAHLTRLTEKALEEKSQTVNVRRRFAHPAWADENRESNEAEMKRLMAEAIVLARSLGDQLLQQLAVTIARTALDELKELGGQLPLNLIAEPVREATAAGAGALLGTPEHHRQAYIILDIGAGTTDVAGCICVNNPDWERSRVFEISTAADAKNSAGNVLDSALVKLFLSKSHLLQASEEYRAAAASLNRNRRLYKERLFQSENGTVLAELPTGGVLELSREEFLSYPPVVALSDAIKDLVTHAAFAVAGDERHLTLVATGGGARLPIVKLIADEGVERDGMQIKITLKDAMPDELRAVYPDLVAPYPQVAVAVGGALPSLPEQRASISEGLTKAPKRYIPPSYKS